MRATNEKFKIFLNEKLSNECFRGLDFFAILIKPLQRITKYPLLLKSLLQQTSELHPDKQDGNAALQALEEIVHLVDNTTQAIESIEKVSDIAERIDGISVTELIAQDRLWIKDAPFIKINNSKIINLKSNSQYYLFLFTDVLLITKIKGPRYKFKPPLMPLEKIIVKDIPDTNECTNIIEISFKNFQKIYLLAAKSLEDKKSWLVDLAYGVVPTKRSNSEPKKKKVPELFPKPTIEQFPKSLRSSSSDYEDDSKSIKQDKKSLLQKRNSLPPSINLTPSIIKEANEKKENPIFTNELNESEDSISETDSFTSIKSKRLSFTNMFGNSARYKNVTTVTKPRRSTVNGLPPKPVALQDSFQENVDSTKKQNLNETDTLRTELAQLKEQLQVQTRALSLITVQLEAERDDKKKLLTEIEQLKKNKYMPLTKPNKTRTQFVYLYFYL